MKVRLTTWWLGNPPHKEMDLTAGEAQLLVNRGAAIYCDAPGETHEQKPKSVRRGAVPSR